jgi:small subunit ribosomal protein S20
VAKLKSSKKRIKQERVQHIRNAAAMSSMRTAVKRFEEDSSQEHLNEALSSLDKAAKRGIIHKNNVARHKSQLMRAANAAS